MKFEKPYFTIFFFKIILIIFKNIVYISFTNIKKIPCLLFLDYWLPVVCLFVFSFQLLFEF